MATKVIEQLIEAEDVKPIAEFNGIKVVTFEDGVKLTQKDILEAELAGDDTDIGAREINSNGLPARSKTKYAAVNTEKMFANRIRYIEEDGTKKMQIVLDYRAISEQETGKIYLKRIPAYQIVRKGKKLSVDKMITVDDSEFIAEFNNALNLNSMLEVLPIIDIEGADMNVEEIGI